MNTLPDLYFRRCDASTPGAQWVRGSWWCARDDRSLEAWMEEMEDPGTIEQLRREIRCLENKECSACLDYANEVEGLENDVRDLKRQVRKLEGQLLAQPFTTECPPLPANIERGRAIEPVGFRSTEDVIRLHNCPDCDGRGWFLIQPFVTGGNGAGGIGNMTQCLTCKNSMEYWKRHGKLPEEIEILIARKKASSQPS